MKMLAVLFANFGPYHLARVSALAEYCKTNNVEVTISGIELAREEAEYSWRSDINNLSFPLHSVIKDQPLESVAADRVSGGLIETLDRLKPDTLAVSGYARPAMRAALKWCRRNRCRTILMSESTEHDTVRNPFKEWYKSSLVRKFDAALVGGKPHIRYLIKLGMAPDRIFTGYDVVDNLQFHPDKIRTMPNPSQTPFFLSVSRFVPKKNLKTLISAYTSYRKKASVPWNLVLCGDGPLRADLERRVQANGLHNCISMPGFLQQDQLLPYFAHASCFVHTSTSEQWGLVVNEAMAAGLPVLLSNRCGCCEDLLLEGRNGFSFDPHRTEQLTELMIRTSSGELNLESMGHSSLELIKPFSPQAFAEGMIRAAGIA